GSWTLNLASGQVVWTEELYRMIGIDPSSPAPGLAQQKEFLTAESWERLTAKLDESLHTGQPWEIELQTRSAAGDGWSLARGEPQRDKQGVIHSLCGIAQDITNRKRGE